MRIVCISDTHEFHRELYVPCGDLLIHAGDCTHQSRLSTLRDFDDWLREQPHLYKIVVPGNHDGYLQEPKNRGVIKNAKLLVNSGVTIEGIRIWGAPVTTLPGEPFGMPDAAERRKLWAKIPKNIDILVTHGPAFGILDQEAGDDEHHGDAELRDAILRLRPPLHICGHVHGGYGRLRTAHTLHVNAALFDELGGVEREPIVVPDFKPLRSR